MSSIVMTKAVAATLAGLMVDADGDTGPFNGCKVGLFKNNIVPSPNTVLADLTQPEATGYALSAAPVWGSAFNGANDCKGITAPSVTFRRTNSDDDEETIYGAFLVTSDGNTLLATKRFEEPVTWAVADDVVIVQPLLSQPYSTPDPVDVQS